jgi:NAD(P)-dependent dehydrogenase (short-subunit alcohol dehydrogenase family)
MGAGFLRDRAVVVTGAGRGLGEAYARLAAAHGASVVVNDVDAASAAAVVERIRGDGGRAVADGADVSTWAGAGALVAACVAEFGAIDGLVNNAAIFRLATPWEQDPEVFDQVVRTNLLGPVYCGLHALAAMAERGRGSIVNVTSGAQAGSTAMAAYGASKGGVAALTYCWAADVAGTGIRVNAVSPNAHTRMADEFERYLGERARGQNVGKPPELNAPAVVFLLSDAAAGINGQVVRVDGTELSLMSHPEVVEPAVHDPQWTVEAVAAAFAGPLGGAVQPLGLRARPSMNREVQSSASREIG